MVVYRVIARLQNDDGVRWNIHAGSHSDQVTASGKGIYVARYQSARRRIGRVVAVVGVDIVVALSEHIVVWIKIQLNIGCIKPAAGVDNYEFIQVLRKAGINHNGLYLWALRQGTV